jgi:hypothetical protein
MTQEDKDLLLKDICSRLPYSVKAQYYGIDEEDIMYDIIDSIYVIGNGTVEVGIGQYGLNIEDIKPYLYPLSSMTEKQKKEQEAHFTCIKHDISFSICRYIEWCYKNHLDINGLIEKGLAIDATGQNIY